VAAQKNLAADRLVACAESEDCRTTGVSDAPTEVARPFPHGCPVYPSLAK
jgi:hypothetical protein